MIVIGGLGGPLLLGQRKIAPRKNLQTKKANGFRYLILLAKLS